MLSHIPSPNPSPSPCPSPSPSPSPSTSASSNSTQKLPKRPYPQDHQSYKKQRIIPYETILTNYKDLNTKLENLIKISTSSNQDIKDLKTERFINLIIKQIEITMYFNFDEYLTECKDYGKAKVISNKKALYLRFEDFDKNILLQLRIDSNEYDLEASKTGELMKIAKSQNNETLNYQWIQNNLLNPTLKSFKRKSMQLHDQTNFIELEPDKKEIEKKYDEVGRLLLLMTDKGTLHSRRLNATLTNKDLEKKYIKAKTFFTENNAKELLDQLKIIFPIYYKNNFEQKLIPPNPIEKISEFINRIHTTKTKETNTNIITLAKFLYFLSIPYKDFQTRDINNKLSSKEWQWQSFYINNPEEIKNHIYKKITLAIEFSEHMQTITHPDIKFWEFKID